MVIRLTHALQFLVLNVVEDVEQLIDENTIGANQLKFLSFQSFLLIALFTFKFPHDLFNFDQRIVLARYGQRIHFDAEVLLNYDSRGINRCFFLLLAEQLTKERAMLLFLDAVRVGQISRDSLLFACDKATVDSHLIICQDRCKRIQLNGKFTVIQDLSFDFQVRKERFVTFASDVFHLYQPVQLAGIPRHSSQRVDKQIEI